MLHSASGVLIWVGFENVFAFMWATGRLAYVSDAEATSTWDGAGRLVLFAALMPPWRDVHFYCAHRLLHFRPLFQLVHALHHRNTDTEPFAGIAMHPVEHLYYFTSVLPSVVLRASPLLLVWTGVHLLITPAGSHSGSPLRKCLPFDAGRLGGPSHDRALPLHPPPVRACAPRSGSRHAATAR